MTHLKVEQSTGTIEQVDKSVIAKLYESLANNTLDQSSNLQGRIHTDATYQEYITYIRAKFPDLYITCDKYYVKFNDPAFQRACAQQYGDGVGMTMEDFQAVTDNSPFWAFNGNSEITDMTEFKYFTNVPGHSRAGDAGYQTSFPFYNLPNLQRFEFPNQIVNIGSVAVQGQASLGYKGVFYSTDALTYCKYPNNLEYIAVSSGPVIMDFSNTKLTNLYTRSDNDHTTEIYLPGTYVSLRIRTFVQYLALKKVVIAEGSSPLQFTVGGYSIMFGAGRKVTLDLPSNTAQVHRSIFQGNNSGEKFILRATTPPTEVTGDSTLTETTEPMINSSQVDLYVPDESISLYQSNTIYSSFKHIYGLSQLPSDYSTTPQYT